MTKIYLINHGESESTDNSWSELTEKGEEQAKALGEGLKNFEINFDKVYSSPAVRAQQTARYCMNGMGIVKPEFTIVQDLEDVTDLETRLKNPEVLASNRVNFFIKNVVLGKGSENAALFVHNYLIKSMLKREFNFTIGNTPVKDCEGAILQYGGAGSCFSYQSTILAPEQKEWRPGDAKIY